MISVEHGPLISQPGAWVLAFDPVAANRWIGALTPGRFKHVRAFGYVPFLHVWIFIDANFAGLEVQLAAEGAPADALAASWTRGCTMVVMQRRPHASRSLVTAASGWCVPTVKRLIGLRSSALRVDALFADCLRNGGTLYGQHVLSTIAPGDNRAAGIQPAGARGVAGPSGRDGDAQRRRDGRGRDIGAGYDAATSCAGAGLQRAGH